MAVKSWYGVLVAGDGFLLGGVKRQACSRFEDEADARAWVEVACEINASAGRQVAAAFVRPSTRRPEILHAGLVCALCHVW